MPWWALPKLYSNVITTPSFSANLSRYTVSQRCGGKVLLNPLILPSLRFGRTRHSNGCPSGAPLSAAFSVPYNQVLAMHKFAIVTALTLAGLGVGAQDAPSFDFGSFVEEQLFAKSMQLFGIVTPVASSSTTSVDAATAEADPTSLVTVANGLHVNVVTAAANAGA